MSVQTTYSPFFKSRVPGMESDQAKCQRREAFNLTGADLDVGLGLTQSSSSDTGAVLPSDASMKLIGIAINTYGRNPNGLSTAAYANNRMLPTVAEGPVTVQIDQDCKPGDPVFVRYAASGNSQTGAVGSFRKDGDGVAAVHTITPSAADSTVYGLDISIAGKTFHFDVTSQVSATATTIVTQFKTAMAADKRFSALVTASGTTTLVLTATLQNEGMVTAKAANNAGTITVAYTTAHSGTARHCRGLRWLSSGTAASGVGEIQFSANEESR